MLLFQWDTYSRAALAFTVTAAVCGIFTAATQHFPGSRWRLFKVAKKGWSLPIRPLWSPTWCFFFPACFHFTRHSDKKPSLTIPILC